MRAKTCCGTIITMALFLMLTLAPRAGAQAPRLVAGQAWSPSAIATPATRQTAEGVALAGNGTATCCGGWQYVFEGIQPGQAYRIRAHAEHKGLGSARDALVAITLWDRWDPKQAATGEKSWNYLFPKPASEHGLDFENTIVAPEGASRLTVRYSFRWSKDGSSEWTKPVVEPVELPRKKPVKICVITKPSRPRDQHVKIEPLAAGLGLAKDVADSVDLWGSLALKACESHPQLIVTPEVAIGGKNAIDGAVEVPGPATRPFEKIAREHNVYLVLGMRQREAGAYYNICALVAPSGKVEGIYRKVHLATSEGLSGLTAGDSFPVFQTAIGRIGCLICMDTMIPESSRMLMVGGADIICLPIMGDLRADRWTAGPPIFSEDRWKALMRTRAIDNQVTMAIARNDGQGSCVIDRKGEIVAWNEGEREVIEATLPAADGYLSWDGGDVREVTTMLRRPHLYAPFVDEGNIQPFEKRN